MAGAPSVLARRSFSTKSVCARRRLAVKIGAGDVTGEEGLSWTIRGLRRPRLQVEAATQ